MIYKLKRNFYQKGDFIVKAYENADSILIIEKGKCEITTEFEGNEFIIEKLY